MGKKETNFKQTDIGRIPHDWEVISLGQIGDVKMCKRIFKSQTKETGEIPFYKIGTFGQTPDAFISRSIFEKYKANYSYPTLGVILLSAAGTIGRRVKYKGEDAYYQDSNIIWLSHIEDKVLNDYLYYAYSRVNWTTEKGAAISRLYNKLFLSARIPHPPIEEQKRIAEVLSHFDEHIDNLVALLEKRKQVKAATMQALLSGTTRLPGFTQPWEKRTIEQISIRYDNLRIPVAENLRVKGRTPYYGANGIQGYVQGYTHNGEFVLIAEDGANDLSNYPTQYVIGKIWVNNHAHVLQGKFGQCSTSFLCYALKTPKYKEIVVGGERAKLNAKTLMEIELFIPTKLEEQEAIASVLSNMDRGIEALEEQIEKYRQMKEGAMEELLTGKVRLI